MKRKGEEVFSRQEEEQLFVEREILRFSMEMLEANLVFTKMLTDAARIANQKQNKILDDHLQYITESLDTQQLLMKSIGERYTELTGVKSIDHEPFYVAYNND